jgi:hypothetical protein
MIGYLASAGRVTEATMRCALIHASVLASFGVEGFSLDRLEGLRLGEVEKRVRDLRRMMAV